MVLENDEHVRNSKKCPIDRSKVIRTVTTLVSCHSFCYASHAACKTSVSSINISNTINSPIGGYSVPFFSVLGSQSHHSFLGIESMTDGTCAPQPNQVRLPTRVVSKEAG